jgi:mannose-6-phosphate isomerase class I
MRGGSNYDKYPEIVVQGDYPDPARGWEEITKTTEKAIAGREQKKIIIIEAYPGTFDTEILDAFRKRFSPALVIDAKELYYEQDEIIRICYPDVTDDRIFGYMTRLNITDFLDPGKTKQALESIEQVREGVIILYGCGASEITQGYDLFIYADMARYEIQQRMRRDLTANLGVSDYSIEFEQKYKRAFFVDWRVADRVKRKTIRQWDYVLDTGTPGMPLMITAEMFNLALQTAVAGPFRLVPFFDPGPWGGQWIREVCEPDREEVNFAWCFDCVPEENSLRFRFGEVIFETPAINLVFFRPVDLLGERVYARFGEEFPIRFDFLDTMDGGNLSLQVHPTAGYIREKFGMFYTQDESYYLLDAKKTGKVYLGLKEGIDRDKMLDDLRKADKGETSFNAEKYIASWPAAKHDHFLIPAGTVHCSAADCMVLEISSTPYIFTFKLWDWGRTGLDGRPRPINIDHGAAVIQWDRTESWVRRELINRVSVICDRGDTREERTGLHEFESIETIRHWFTGKVHHPCNGSVNVLNLVEGREAIVESPGKKFRPFAVHYAETFVIPASAGDYTIRPHGGSEGQKCATIKAYIRK